MAASPVMSIEALGVDAVQMTHASCEIRLWCPNQKMKVIAHLTVGIHTPVKSLRYLGQDLEPFTTVIVTRENARPLVTSGGYMIEGFGKLDSKWPGHKARSVSLGAPTHSCRVDLTITREKLRMRRQMHDCKT